jgi:hypothetical protein
MVLKKIFNTGAKKMKRNCYLKPAWTHNGCVPMDTPLKVIGKKRKTRRNQKRKTNSLVERKGRWLKSLSLF